MSEARQATPHMPTPVERKLAHTEIEQKYLDDIRAIAARKEQT